MTRTVDHVVVGLGGLGSAAAYQLASRGRSVLGLEQFELGHVRGASHDTSRILRRSYHTPGYVRLAGEAYDDWSALGDASGQALVTTTGGIDLFPPDPAIDPADYTGSLTACGVPFDVLDPAEVSERWPAVRLPDRGVALHQRDTGIVNAAATVRVLQQLARQHGAELLEHTPARVQARPGGGVTVETPGGRIECGSVVVTADAWTNTVLAPLGVRLPLTVTQEQVTYFTPAAPEPFAPGRFPTWIWMDDPSFYGFPTYAGPELKAGQDVGGRVTTATARDFEPDRQNLRRLTDFMARTFPGSTHRVGRTVTCLYTLTPDRDFVMSPLPEHPGVVVGLGAGHGFKFAPTFGRVLADLATTGRTGSDVSEFGIDRAALRRPTGRTSWVI